MSFIPVRLNIEIEERAKVRSMFETDMTEMDGGDEKRNDNWAQPKFEWNLSGGVQNREQLEELQSLWFVTKGPWLTWLFKDHSNYQIPGPGTPYVTKQPIAQGDGVTVDFQLFRRWVKGAYTFDQEVYKIISGTQRAWIDTTELAYTAGAPGAGQFTVDFDTGILTTGDVPLGPLDTDGPEQVYAACEFEHLVRFKEEEQEWVTHHEDLYSLPAILIKGTRYEEDL